MECVQTPSEEPLRHVREGLGEDELVAEHWLYRHGILAPYDSLPIGRIRFKQETRELNRILSLGEGAEPLWSPNWSEDMETDPNRCESELAQYLLANAHDSSPSSWPIMRQVLGALTMSP